MIDLTPLEVRKKKGDFRRALRGYEPALVDDFLDMVADRLEQLTRENAAMGERLADLERRVGEYRDREKALTDALVTAQEMREEVRVQTVREAELARRTSTQEAETRLQDAEQRSQTMLREAEHQAQTLVRDAEQHAASTVRSAEQGASDTLRRAQQEADAELRHAQQEAARLQAEVIQVREREEAALKHLRQQQHQQLSLYRNFLQRELSELEIIATSLIEPDADGPAELPASPAAETPEAEPGTGPPRDSRAAAAAAVLAQSFLSEEQESPAARVQGMEAFDLTVLDDLEPFEPEPVYAEDLEPHPFPVEPPDLPGDELDGEAGEGAAPDDPETTALLENAALAGYRLELEDEPELLLEEAAPESDDEGGDDWLTSIIKEDK